VLTPADQVGHVVPSARELGISARHRRALMRETDFRIARACARGCVDDAVAVQAHEAVGVMALYIVGGERAADGLRDSLLSTGRRFHGEAADYLRRRAAGESARSIRIARYAQAAA
jgi:hypothetical protein